MKSNDALIAVVDDDASVRKAMQRALQFADYRVAAFASGEAFLASLEEAAPACVVIDVDMPGSSGVDVAKAFRTLGLGAPIIFVTGGDDPALRREADAVGAAKLLLKPFSMDLLCNVIDCVVA